MSKAKLTKKAMGVMVGVLLGYVKQIGQIPHGNSNNSLVSIDKQLFSMMIILIMVIFWGLSAYGEPVQIVGEAKLPPLSYKENNKITGMAVEIVQATLKELNNHTEIKLYPWARAYRMVMEEKNTLIFRLDHPWALNCPRTGEKAN